MRNKLLLLSILILGLATIAVLLFCYVIVSSVQKSTKLKLPSYTKLASKEDSNLKELSITFTDKAKSRFQSLPKNALVFRTNQKYQFPLSEADRLASSLGFDSKPTQKVKDNGVAVYHFETSDRKAVLDIGKYNAEITFSSAKVTYDNTTPTFQNLTSLLQSLNIPTNNVVQTKLNQDLGNDRDLFDDEDSKNITYIDATYKIGDLDTMFESLYLLPIRSAWLGSKPVYLYLFNPIPLLDKLKLPIKSLNSLTKDLKTNKAFVTDFQKTAGSKPATLQIESINLNYFMDRMLSSEIQPIFILQAKILDNQNKALGEATLHVPAIQNRFFGSAKGSNTQILSDWIANTF